MKLDKDICSGGRLNKKNITGIRYNGIDIYSIIGYYNAYTVEILPDGDKTVHFDNFQSSYYYNRKKDPYFNMGDGSIFYEDISSYTYTAPGTYLIITSGEIKQSTSSNKYYLNYRVIAINGMRRDIKRTYNVYNYDSLVEFIPENVNTSNVIDMSSMFWSCNALALLDVSKFDTSNVTSMKMMFSDCQSLTSLDVSGFDTSNVTDMKMMFSDCQSLTSLDVSGFDTSNVTDMDFMFSSCYLLTELDTSKFNTSNVTTMTCMFNACSLLTNLDVSGFITDNVTSMNGMFNGCTNITELDLSKFNTTNVTDMTDMFRYCSNLITLNISNFDICNTSDMYVQTTGMLFGCYNLQELYLNNCSYDTISKIINDHYFPVNNNGTIYCKKSESVDKGLTEPGNWQFSYID